jgi:hypothetical protein
MRIIAVVFMILFFVPFAIAESQTVDITIGVSGGYLISGLQADIANYSFIPSPDSLPSAQLELGLRYNFIELLGIEASFSFGKTLADWRQFSTDISVYDNLTASCGIILRAPLHVSNTMIILFAGGGMNVNFLWYDKQFVDLMASAGTPYGLIPFIGGFGKAGVDFYFNSHVFIGGGIEYIFSNVIVDVANIYLEGHYIRIPVWFGISIY